MGMLQDVSENYEMSEVTLLLFPRMLIVKQMMKIKGAKAYYIINTVTLLVYALLSKYIEC